MKTHISKKKASVLSVFVALILCLTLVFPLVQSNVYSPSETIYLTYFFSSPTIETIAIEETLYHRITMPECYPATNAGEPKLPSKGVFILLPPQSQVDSIEVTTSEKITLGSDFLVEPTSQAIPRSQITNIPVPTPNQALYQTNAEYPGRLYSTVGVYSFRGYDILVLLLHPIHYNPVSGEVSYYQTLDLMITTINTDKPADLYRGLPQDLQEVMVKVDNPEMSHRYQDVYTTPSTRTEHYELLIITTDVLKSGFVPLQQAHDQTGVPTIIKTLTDIGSSSLESIRNYIRDAYLNWDVNYVLIGGDTDVVPAPILWVSGMDENVTYYETTMPSDLYYACLDGPYNYNGNDKWGEPTDGEDGGDVDLIAEVYVGRACVGNIAEVNNFVTKTVAYINKDLSEEFFTRVTLAGEYLGNYGIASYGGAYLDQLVNGSTDDGYTTLGIPASSYTINKLYDAPGYDWPTSAIISIINNGVHIINHLGHASYTYNLKMSNSQVSSLNNPSDQACFIYSQGCMAGGFDNGDCIAEYFTIKSASAAFAGVWNARYGWFWSHSTDGDSQRFHREFWDAVFGENIAQIGRANHDSKEDNLPIIGRSCIRWCYYQTNLFGDPTLCIIEANQPPETPSTPVGPSQGTVGMTFTFSTSTTDPEDDLLYYQWDWGTGVFSDWLGPYTSGLVATASYQWDAPGDYQVRVQAKDSKGVLSDWSAEKLVCIVDIPQLQIGEIRGLLRITADIQNTGGVVAQSVPWTITLQGTILYGNETSGRIIQIQPGGSSRIYTGFIFGFGPISITVSITDQEKTTTAYLLGPIVLNIQ